LLPSQERSTLKDVTTYYFHEQQDLELSQRVFRFRKSVLVDLHQWRLSVMGDVERDEFDHDYTVHCAMYRGDQLVGVFRALRSDTPYLAATKFPHLAIQQPYTKNPLSWEVSRLTIAPDERRFETSLLLYAAMFQFIKLRRARSIVGFCDVAHQRLLERVGIETQPYGPAVEIGTDGANRPVVVVAGEMPLPKSPSIRFRKLMSLVDRMEIHDETAFLGHSSLSA